MLGEDETLGHSVIHRGKQVVVVIAHIEQTNRLFVRAGLRPGDGFKQFVPCAEAAGQGNISVSEFVHARLATVHTGQHPCE